MTFIQPTTSSIARPVVVPSQLAEPSFKVLLEDQNGGGRSHFQRQDFPEDGEGHSRRRLLPELVGEAIPIGARLYPWVGGHLGIFIQLASTKSPKISSN